jgi:prepilin-type N-terminal cleavage/methylation domain-containing protein
MIHRMSKYMKNAGSTSLEITESSYSKTKRKYPLSLTGFTLVEIAITVALISVLAIISIPMMLRNHINSNEVVAIASCRTIAFACQGFYSVSMPRQYPEDLAILNANNPPYIDSVLASGKKSGYDFVYSKTSPASFTLNADPQFPGRTGNRYFFTDETGRITAKEGGHAGPGDPSIN